jgi:hypothetical protein
VRVNKKTIIAGKEWRIVTDPKRDDAEFSSRTKTIILGAKEKSELFNLYLHETLEAILAERLCRYHIYSDGNDKLLFSFNHSELELIVQDLQLVINDFFKQRGKT